MTEQPSRVSVRFCAGCGAPAPDGASFCVACGDALHAAADRRGARPSGSPSAAPGVAVLAAFLAIGLALWFAILRPEERVRQPLAAKPDAPAAQGGETSPSLPTEHPPVAIPEEVLSFITDLEKRAETSPEDLQTWRQLAQVQFRAGQIDPAYLTRSEASWRHVLEREPKDREALRGLGNLHFDREEHAKAIEAYQAYLAVDTDDPNVRTDLGTMYLYSGRFDDAIREYGQVLAAEPGFYQAHFNLGVAHLRKGDRDEALASFEAAQKTAPDDDTRQRIAMMIERTRGDAPKATSDGFQSQVERNLRAHPIAGPKIVRFEWPSPAEARVILENFPMEAMPEFARAKFLERLETELGEARAASAIESTARLELVDQSSGTVMATIQAPGKGP